MLLNALVNNLRQIEGGARAGKLPLAIPQQLTMRKEKSTNKILHIVYVLTHVGVCGGTKIIFEHAEELNRLGAKVTLVSHFGKPEWYPLTVDYLTIPFQIELARGIPQCDVIVATYWDHIQACVESGIAPVVYFEQGDFHLYDWGQDLVSEDIKKVVELQYKLAPFIITVSGMAANLIKEKFAREAAVIHNALDNNVFYPKAADFEPKKKYMLIVGRDQTKFKGIDDLRSVYQILKDQGYDIEVLWMTQQQPDLSMGEVVVNPPMPVIGDLYRKAFVYVCGSYYEAFPLPPLEAMACGTPVVSTSNVGVKEYAVHGYNCLLAEPGDIAGLVKAIIRLLEDNQLYKELQQNGYQTASNFKWEKNCRRLLAYYSDVAQYEPVPRYTENDWELLYRDEDFIDGGDALRAKLFLAHTPADVIVFPVERSLVSGIKLINWKVMAKKKQVGTGYIDRAYFKLNGARLPKVDSWVWVELYQQGNFAEILQQGENTLGRVSHNSPEGAIIMRWLAMSLLELERYAESEKYLEEALSLHPLYTDLYYIKGVIEYLQGNVEQGNVLMEVCKIIQDAAFYPEYFANIEQLAVINQNRGTAHD
ncbi:MAG: glycosyl transferase group 1 [Firmicutes bacterium]|nr:glycosyl transferase group 1 [Bacillota bacterium]